MFDTVRLFKNGRDGKDFEIKKSMFKKRVDEFNNIEKYQNSFRDFHNNSIHIEYDLFLKGGINISFSIPKIANNNQIENFKLSDRDRLIENLYNSLQDKVDIDFENMRVSRLDITSNIQTELKAKNYINCLVENYNSQNNYKQISYQDESFTIYNKSRRFVFYDKIAEQVKKGVFIDKVQREQKNILRYEIQNNKGRDVKMILGRDFLFKDLFNESVFLDCIDVQKKYFSKIFMNNKKQLNLFETDKKLIDVLMIKNKRNIMIKYLVKKYIDSNEFSFQSLEMLFNDCYSERGLRKAIRDLKELKFLLVKTDYSLLSEIYDKISGLYKLVV